MVAKAAAASTEHKMRPDRKAREFKVINAMISCEAAAVKTLPGAMSTPA
jgi:hypothetical protein